MTSSMPTNNSVLICVPSVEKGTHNIPIMPDLVLHCVHSLILDALER